jgi:hypothetical protein
MLHVPPGPPVCHPRYVNLKRLRLSKSVGACAAAVSRRIYAYPVADAVQVEEELYDTCALVHLDVIPVSIASR